MRYNRIIIIVIIIYWIPVQDDIEILKALRRTKSFRTPTKKALNSKNNGPGVKRRNSTGTIYLGATMSSQDNQVRGTNDKDL